MPVDVDAVVVGSGPNGLVAAVTLARAGWRVVVLEAGPTPGGGTRTEELTLPGFRHDVCSAIHPLGIASPAFRDLDLTRAGVRWIHPPVALGHGVTPGHSALLRHDLDATAAGFGDDERAWRRLFAPLVRAGDDLVDSLLSPIALPRHPLTLARFGLPGIRSASSLGRSRFRGDDAGALLGGVSAHSMLSLDSPITAGLGMFLVQLAHHVGWPLAEGGSQAIADALVAELVALGGDLRCGERVTSLDDLPSARAVLCDVTPRQLLDIAGDRLPSGYRRSLGRFRYGPGVCKVDWALDGPVPWLDGSLDEAGTVHLGGTLAEVRAAEEEVQRGRHPERPFLLLSQQSRFDRTRVPDSRPGGETLWGYCHVPHGSPVDMTERMEARIEEFAPGFRDRIIARHTMVAPRMEAHNANYVGGDINAGRSDLRQFLFRPLPSPVPWATPVDGLYLCSSSTPPGGGVHGMCGMAAAKVALRRHG